MSDNTQLVPTSEPSDIYQQTLEDIKVRIRASRYKALQAVNQELIGLYWDLGRIIVERQEAQGWGESTVKQLAKDIQVEFPGISGFSLSNLWRMRSFYLTYKDNEKLAPLVRDIAWTHNILIMERCKSDLEREFYLRVAAHYGWSKLTLADNIKAQAYERWALQQVNFDRTLSEDQRSKATLAIKDDYDFSFLELEESHKERKLEASLVENITKFLAEMGTHFTFVGRQVRIEFHEREYFIDLLFYHRKLKCLVAIDLKAREFEPADAGQMQFYLTVLDESERLEGENPSIGMIICKAKDRIIVEYTLRYEGRPIGVATYNSYSNLKDLPAEIAKYLPSEEELQKRFGDIRTLKPGKKEHT